MRLGALQSLAQLSGGGKCSAVELDEARRAIHCIRPEVAWEAIVLESGGEARELEPVVELIGAARRVGVGVLETIECASRLSGMEPAGLNEVDEGAYVAGTTHALPEGEASRVVRDIAARIGVTRIAQIGELERFGLHVTSAYRPSEWSSTIGSGKSETLEGATIGCVMEEVEKYCQETFGGDEEGVAAFSELVGDAVDASAFDLPFDTRHNAQTKIGWTRARDLLTGTIALVPSTLFCLDRRPNDPLYSPRRGCRVFSTSGLAAGFSLAEALVHALCELIERHAQRLSEQAVSNPGGVAAVRWPGHQFVDLETCPASTKRIVSAIRSAGYEARVMDMTSEVTVPSFAARIVVPRAVHGVDVMWPGSCTHPDPEVGINRALMECVQSRVTFMSGAREDFALRVRSLGRHGRPQPGSVGDAVWFRPYVPKKAFESLGGVASRSAREALAFIVRRLAAAGFSRAFFKDLSREDVAPARVARVLVPEMETANAFYTGVRAKTLLVADLMHRHSW